MYDNWTQLVAGDVALTKEAVEEAFTSLDHGLLANVAIINNDPDGLLRLAYMAHIHSVPHLVGDEMQVVVSEGQHSVAFGFGPYLDASKTGGVHYRTADNLGLDGTPHGDKTYSVLVPHDQLHLIGFTDVPEPMRDWEKELLTGS